MPIVTPHAHPEPKEGGESFRERRARRAKEEKQAAKKPSENKPAATKPSEKEPEETRGPQFSQADLGRLLQTLQDKEDGGANAAEVNAELTTLVREMAANLASQRMYSNTSNVVLYISHGEDCKRNWSLLMLTLACKI